MLQPGDQVGPYEIEALVGQGGMAAVYKAYHRKLDRHVAIKMMHQMFQQEPNFLTRFEREAQIIARLEHPNIVPIYDFSDADGIPYLVMRFVEGETLAGRLKRGPLSTGEILRIMTPVAAALDYAHQRGVLHRDIKPANIIIDDVGTPYLTDFGLARLVALGASSLSQGNMIGTPHYISPEQALGQTELTPHTDVYSLGVVLYELVVGRVPFPGDTPFSIVHDHIYSPLPPPSALNASVSPAVEAVLTRALAKDPADRFDSAGALIEAYREAAAGGDNPAVSAASARPRVKKADPESPIAPPVIPLPSPPPDTTEFEIRMENIGEVIEEKVEKFAEAVESWVEKFGESDSAKPSTKRRRRKELTPEEKIRREVEKRHKERQGFITHLVIYLVVNLAIWSFWWVIGGGFAWPVFVTFGWGIGIVSHTIDYLQKYGPGARRLEREIERELEKARREGRIPPPEVSDQDAGYMEKAKNEDLTGQRLRLTDDGELSQSFIEELEGAQKPKRGRQR